MRHLNVPTGPVDVILDTDTYNEIDDQFALSYLVRSEEKLHVVGFTAAPFFNENSTSPADGMEKSYQEILHLLDLLHRPDLKEKTFRGSDRYLLDEQTPVPSEAALFLAETSRAYSAEHPLYIVAIGAITNVASALLMEPTMRETCVVVWLGGHALSYGAGEFNMMQDIAAARVVMLSGIPFVQLPCRGVVDAFHTTGPELNYWLTGKNPLCDYLVQHTVETAESYAKGRPWSRVIWDVTTVAWLLNDHDRFMTSCLIHAPVPEPDLRYAEDPNAPLIRYVTHINRDALMEDLFTKLTKN